MEWNLRNGNHERQLITSISLSMEENYICIIYPEGSKEIVLQNSVTIFFLIETLRV